MSPTHRGLFVFVIGLAFLAGALAFDYWWLTDGGGSDTATAPAGVSIGGPFTLRDQTGATRHDTDFRGRLMLVYFGYTYCPDACPTALQDMSGALDLLDDKAKDLALLFITVDPERDTVAQMKLYASNFHARLVALTGTPEQAAAAAKAYRIYYKKVEQSRGDDYLVDHSSFIFLMDRNGRYLTHFAPNASAETMATAIRKYL